MPEKKSLKEFRLGSGSLVRMMMGPNELEPSLGEAV